MNTMKKFSLFLLAALAVGSVKAQVRDVEVLAEKDTVWTLPPNHPLLGKRQMHRIDIAYNSVDPYANLRKLFI